MGNSTLITDYVGRGLHSARPSSPPIGSGSLAVYFETDTGSLCIWNGSSWDVLAAWASPTDGQVLTWSVADGQWEPKPGGGGGPSSGTPIWEGAFGSGSNNGWADQTLIHSVYGRQFSFSPSSWKVVFEAIGGTGLSIASCWLFACSTHDTNVLYTTGYAPVQIKFGGSGTYSAPFSGASSSSPFRLVSDAISGMTLDDQHDYWIYTYLDTDGSGYNAALTIWSATDGGPSPQRGNSASGNTTPSTTSGGTVAACTYGKFPLIVGWEVA